MTSVADVLELMHGARRSFRTVRATIRNWRDEARYKVAWERHADALEKRGGVFLYVFGDSDDEEDAEPPEETTRVWLERPGKARLETEGRWSSVVVVNGRALWNYSPGMGAVAQELSEPADAGFAGHLVFSPATLTGSLDFEVTGETALARRDAIQVRAKSRIADPPWLDLYGLAPGADEYELLVDAERGILLRAAAYLDGAEFATTEVVEIAFDEPIDPERFRFVPPPGERVRTQEELAEEFREISVEEAAARASFTVWVPGGLGPGYTARAHHYAGAESERSAESVSIHYVQEHGDDFKQFELHERADAGNEPGREWERIEPQGQTVFVWTPVERRRGMPTRVLLSREGTRIELSSPELGRDALLDIATSLVPAPTERPPLFE